MTQKVPPPPPVANQDPTFNRWLLELTSILNGDGSIDPVVVPGLDALQAEVDRLQTQINAQQANINSLFAINIRTDARLNVLETAPAVSSGTVPPSPAQGKDTDWYYNRAGAAGARLYIKIGGVWTAQAI